MRRWLLKFLDGVPLGELESLKRENASLVDEVHQKELEVLSKDNEILTLTNKVVFQQGQIDSLHSLLMGTKNVEPQNNEELDPIQVSHSPWWRIKHDLEFRARVLKKGEQDAKVSGE